MERDLQKSVSYASFAGIWFFVSGIFNIMSGFAALWRKEYFDEASLIYENLQVWGWTWVIIGVIGLLVGWLILKGSQSGRLVGIFFAILGLSVWFLNVGAYPVWAIINMVVYGIILYGLTVYGEAFD